MNDFKKGISIMLKYMDEKEKKAMYAKCKRVVSARRKEELGAPGSFIHYLEEKTDEQRFAIEFCEAYEGKKILFPRRGVTAPLHVTLHVTQCVSGNVTGKGFDVTGETVADAIGNFCTRMSRKKKGFALRVKSATGTGEVKTIIYDPVENAVYSFSLGGKS